MVNLNKNRNFNVNMEFREKLLTDISAEIEAKFGRRNPKICKRNNYEFKKESIYRRIKDGKHYNEKDWPDCNSILLRNIGEDSAEEKSRHSIPVISESVISLKMQNNWYVSKGNLLIFFLSHKTEIVFES